MRTYRNLKMLLSSIAGAFLMLYSWYALSLFITLATEGWWAPLPTYSQPPRETWCRTANDFFERPPGKFVPAVIVTGSNMALFVARFFRSRKRTSLLWIFALTNLAFMVIDAVLVVKVAHRLPDLWLPQPRLVPDVGYHRTWPPIALTSLLLSLLFRVQLKLSSTTGE